jgi:superfamily II DNA/RNA helicase
MARTTEEIERDIQEAVQPGFRYRLLARGQSRGMVWRGGILPEGVPAFSPELTDDLLSYGYALLTQALRLLELGGDTRVARLGFEVAAEALEAVVYRGPSDPTSDFHRLLAAAAYHLGRFSARAFSILNATEESPNLSRMESAVAQLMLRDLQLLEDGLRNQLLSSAGRGGALVERLSALANSEGEEEDVLDALQGALEAHFLSALSSALLALERGDEALMTQGREQLGNGLAAAAELSLVAPWWCYRLTLHLLGDLWSTSFHQVLPTNMPSGGQAEAWTRLRRLFIASLYRRKKAEIELWPSQVDAARQVLNYEQSLVLSLPTSAGKTRIAELCILACLAQGKRVVYITPLRALSAQTEVGLRRTFAPLGKTVSSLYGSIGASGADVDAIKGFDVVVATPEKLDFALRSDPELLDDVGLVVLDEGHMIGIDEREVRYEAQIQRLLRRKDAGTRRIVCLSAILPEGDQLEDFAAWLTQDKPGGLIRSQWRPTRLRFGEVDWKGDRGRLNVTVGDETPFVPGFVVAKKPTKGKARKLFPSNQRELCIATAWRLLAEGQTVLIFCPRRDSVLPYAECIIEMHKRGHIESALTAEISKLDLALAVGREWFGDHHVILKCLRLGVVIHHGALPTAYRKEIERLLRDGVLSVTISSPTLTQGLNLSATSLIFHGHVRERNPISVAEFKNVIGRAGRAYVDVEGLVLYPMFDKHAQRRQAWGQLIAGAGGRRMESGLAMLLASLVKRMQSKLGTKDANKLLEYVLGQGGWDFPEVAFESSDDREAERIKWENHLARLDTAIFSLLGDEGVADDEVEARLEEVLEASLFMRRLTRHGDAARLVLLGAMKARAKLVWTQSTAAQRRGYFLAGIGLSAGKKLDQHAQALEELLITANSAIETRNEEAAIHALTGFAQIALKLAPFAPEKLPDDWPSLLREWLLGHSLQGVSDGDEDEVVTFVERVFAYNMPWAMEAVRVRASAYNDPFSDSLLTLSDFPRAHAVGAVETGTLSIPASLLIQAGFASRLGAIEAAKSTGADFDSLQGLRTWLRSGAVQEKSEEASWPTPESHKLWVDFRRPTGTVFAQAWKELTYQARVKWVGVPMPPGAPLRIDIGSGSALGVYTSDYQLVGHLPAPAKLDIQGLVLATASGASDSFQVHYLGPIE